MIKTAAAIAVFCCAGYSQAADIYSFEAVFRGYYYVAGTSATIKITGTLSEDATLLGGGFR